MVVHDAPAASVEDLYFAEGNYNSFELVIPRVELLVELRDNTGLELVSQHAWVQQDFVSGTY